MSQINTKLTPAVLDLFVPYTGATGNVDLGSNYIKAQKVGVAKIPVDPLDVEGDASISGDVYLKAGKRLYFDD